MKPGINGGRQGYPTLVFKAEMFLHLMEVLRTLVTHIAVKRSRLTKPKLKLLMHIASRGEVKR